MTQAVPTRRRRNHGYGATRERILAEAREIMRVEGVGGLSMHELARRVGMKTPSLYTYFESKFDLYDAIFCEGMRAYRARQDEIEREHGNTPAAMEAALVDYVRMAIEEPELWALLFERPVPGFVPGEESLREAFGLMADSNRRIAAALESGIIRSGLGVEGTRDLFLVLMHGLASLRHANEPDAPLEGGRFGPLIPQVMALIRAAWIDGPANENTQEETS